MRAYKGEYSTKETFSKPSGKWRKLYQCRPNKGDHEFKLVKPNYSFMQEKYGQLTVEEYYEQERIRKAGRSDWFSKVMYHYECIHCKKHEYAMDDEKLPNRRIRVIIGNSYNG